MSIKSINEPEGPGRTTMLLPMSINEPLTGENLPPPDTPQVVSLDPDNATIGDPSFTMFVHGSSFYGGSVIVFAGHDEPTTLEEDGTLSTGINMDVWHGPDVVKVAVRNGEAVSSEVDFTFNAGTQRSTRR